MIASAAVVRISGEVGVSGGACFTEQVETGRLDIGTDGHGDDASGAGTLLREGVFVRGGAVLELRFRGRSGGQRGHDGEHEKKREEDGLTHGGHPAIFGMSSIAFQ